MVETHHAAHPLPDAAAIEKQLTQLWREVGTSDEPMMRARVLSLVTVTPDERESEVAGRLMQLAERHPARNVLLLLGDADDEAHFDASATLLCGMNERALCAEQIHLHATGAARERLPGAVRGLLPASLPVVLWWTLPPLADAALFDQLATQADLVVVDSAQASSVAALAELPPAWVDGPVVDLAWGRLLSWRQLVAMAFDDPALLAYLPKIEEIAIEHGPSPAPAWLLAGWFADRLGWAVEGAAGETLRFTRDDGGAVTVRLHRAGDEGALHAITVRGGGATLRAWRCDHNSAACEVTLPNSAPMRRVMNLRSEEALALLSRELDEMKRDPLYHAALAVVRALVAAAGD